MDYPLLKVVHLGALIFWLGPALGAWLVFKVVEHDSVTAVTAKVNRMFFAMVTLEHLAFITLIATGLLMAHKAGWFASPWMQQKLIVVGVVIIPLEVVDVLLGNWLVFRASRKKYSGQSLTHREQRWVSIYHGPFTRLAIFLIPLSVFMVMYLAVSKLPLL